jgi:hypothetical protein
VAVVCYFCGDEEVAAGDVFLFGEEVFDCLANLRLLLVWSEERGVWEGDGLAFFLVVVAEGRVDVPEAGTEGVQSGFVCLSFYCRVGSKA